VDLEDGEVICSRCKGSGLLNETGLVGVELPKDPSFIVFECYACCGTGKVDWITNIVGFNREIFLTKRTVNQREYNELRTRRS